MKYGDDKKEKLERLQKKLYSRNTPDIIDTGRTELKKSEYYEDSGGAREDWQEMKTGSFDELAQKVSNMAQKKHSFIKKIFVFSILFFVVAAGVAGFVFFGGVNTISSKNVDIKIVGPLSVGAGQEISLDINVINNNNVDLSSVSLLVRYPEGVRSVDDLSKELNQERFSLGVVKSGQSYSQNIKAVFFGEKESIKKIQISLEYRVENSSALFFKEKTHEISINSAPIIITPTYPKEVNSNQEMSFNVEVASNSKDKLNNFLLKVEYPSGFVFNGSSPAASFGNNIWRLSDLNPGEKKTILIKGNIIGQNNEERVFKISAGTASESDERAIAVPFSALTESVLIKKPFINLGISIGGKQGDYVGQGGSQVSTELTVMNNLPSKIFNASVTVSFKGGAFNELSVAPEDGGFFQSLNDTIFWDKRTVSDFYDMGPGAQKQLSFSLSPLSYSSIAKGVKPEIEMMVTAKGERILESGSTEQISVTEIRKIILVTDLLLFSKIARSIGNIENFGPIPPKVDTPTTYTVIWSISNSLNQVSNVEVRATLPSYVKWTSLKNPQSENFSFNEVTNEVVWNAGSILPGTGFGSSQKQIHFQLEFLPSSSQIGGSPQLLNITSVSGIDKITGSKIEFKVPALNTNFYGDPIYKEGDDKVIP